MQKLRSMPPIEGETERLDYRNGIGNLPKSDVLKFLLSDGWIAVRPSGTEPKIKIYVLAHDTDRKELKKKIEAGDPNKIYDVDLTYITSRGKWFHYSWKGDIAKSGGLATNIGIHFFDMLQYIFGKKKMLVVHHRDNHVVSGYLELEKARVRWFLSVDSEYLPDEIKAKGQTTYRSIQIAGDELEFTGGFTDLHTESYRNILAGNGFGLDQAKPSIEMVHFIRNAEVVTTMKDCEHPFISRIK